MERKQKHILQKYVTAEKLYAPGGHESICHIKLKPRAHRAENEINELGILTPERKFVQSHGLAMARTLVDASSSAVFARILNPGDSTVTINKGTPVALLMPIAEVGQSVNLQKDEINRPQEISDEVSMEIPDHLKQVFEQACQNLTKEQIVQFKNFVIQHQENFAKPGKVGARISAATKSN